MATGIITGLLIVAVVWLFLLVGDVGEIRNEIETIRQAIEATPAP